MDEQQTNNAGSASGQGVIPIGQNNGQYNGQDESAEPNDMLPPVQPPTGDNGQGALGALGGLPPISPMAPLGAAAPHDDSQQTIPDSRSLVAVPDLAGDNDLIEKEWVLKAKQIVEQTAEDPFMQQQELSRMKSEYMKKRYNKDLGTV